ncbi:MAG: YggT family protein [Candidatus Omnitrophica bacterium]|nr:YggT family protein [Candidatus Omnitrophota bacterium]MCF7894665.1 YggT family protein [Candidatus Omnitrophota bacterium]
MFVLSNFLIAAANVLNVIFTIAWWLILIRALISWVNPDPYNPIVQFLYKTTEPILYPIRRLLPQSLRFGIDVSPIIAFLAIVFFRSFLVQTLYQLAINLR